MFDIVVVGYSFLWREKPIKSETIVQEQRM